MKFDQAKAFVLLGGVALLGYVLYRSYNAASSVVGSTVEGISSTAAAARDNYAEQLRRNATGPYAVANPAIDYGMRFAESFFNQWNSQPGIMPIPDRTYDNLTPPVQDPYTAWGEAVALLNAGTGFFNVIRDDRPADWSGAYGTDYGE